MGLKYFMVQGRARGSFSLVSGLGMFLVFRDLINTLIIITIIIIIIIMYIFKK